MIIAIEFVHGRFDYNYVYSSDGTPKLITASMFQIPRKLFHAGKCKITN